MAAHLHPGRWHRTPMALFSRLDRAADQNGPRAAPVIPLAASSRLPPMLPESNAPRRGHRPWSANQPRASCASPPCNLHRHEHILRFVMLPEAVEISALQTTRAHSRGLRYTHLGALEQERQQQRQHGKKVHQGDRLRRHLHSRRLILSGPRRNGSNSSARRRLPRQHGSSRQSSPK